MYYELILILSYLYSTIFAAVVISFVMYILAENGALAEHEIPFGKGIVLSQWQVAVLGVLERFLYLTSILVGKPEFVAVWLTIKTVYISWSEYVGQPKGTSTKSKQKHEQVFNRRAYNNFLIGNGISVLFALAGAGFFQWATGFTSSISQQPSEIFKKNWLLASASWDVPIIFSLALFFFLWYVNRQLKNNNKR